MTDPETDDKLNTADTSNTESRSEIWYWNKSGIENNTDPEEEEYYNVKNSKPNKKTGQLETRQVEARQVKARQVEAGQVEAGQIEAGQVKARQAEAGQAEARQSKAAQLKIETTTIPSLALKNLGLKFNKKRKRQLCGTYRNG